MQTEKEQIIRKLESLLQSVITNRDNIEPIVVGYYGRIIGEAATIFGDIFEDDKITALDFHVSLLESGKDDYMDNSGTGFAFSESTSSSCVKPMIDAGNIYCDKIIFQTKLQILINKIKNLQ